MIQPKTRKRGKAHVDAQIGHEKEGAQDGKQTGKGRKEEDIRRNARPLMRNERAHGAGGLVQHPRRRACGEADEQDGDLRNVVHLNRRRTGFSRACRKRSPSIFPVAAKEPEVLEKLTIFSPSPLICALHPSSVRAICFSVNASTLTTPVSAIFFLSSMIAVCTVFSSI